MKVKKKKIEKKMEMESNHLISLFLTPSFCQQRKSKQQLRMMQPTILELLKKTKQKRVYDRRHMSQTEINVGDIVLLKNNKRFDRKRGKFSQKWLSPYTVMSISDKGVATLKNASVVTLNNKYNIIQLKNYIQGADDNHGIMH